MKKRKIFMALHLILLIYSISVICSKMAGKYPFFSLQFCIFYGFAILLLGIYAIAWQQIIKRLPLSVAFANKAVTVIWGSIWGAILFQESITIGKIFGIFMVIAGIILYAYSENLETDG